MNILPRINPPTNEERLAKIERSLMLKEAEIGGQLFGPVPKGHIRQFFCLDEHTWIWHESWPEDGKARSITTRYDIRPNAVLKMQGNSGYRSLSLSEARNLYRAINLYLKKVTAEFNRLRQAA